MLKIRINDLGIQQVCRKFSNFLEKFNKFAENILANAVKFTPAGGRIRVRMSTTGSRIDIVVSDTGQGISAEFLPRVFDNLSQERGSSTRGHGRLGLGLSIVRQLGQMHGGTVCAESDGEGKGATFTVSLPAREQPLRH